MQDIDNLVAGFSAPVVVWAVLAVATIVVILIALTTKAYQLWVAGLIIVGMSMWPLLRYDAAGTAVQQGRWLPMFLVFFGVGIVTIVVGIVMQRRSK